MPATWNIPRQQGIFSVDDVEKFNRMPVWMANQQTKEIPFWSRWENIFGTIPWESNMGDILQGVMAEMPPVTQQSHTPRNITESPLKTVVSHFERGNTARVKRHLFESPLIHWLPSFRDFRRRQVPFASKALNKIVGTGLDLFYRWQVLQQSRTVLRVDAAEPLQNVPAGEATDVSAPKDTAWFATQASQVGNSTGFLDFRWIAAVKELFANDIGAVPWEGLPGTPSENKTMQGKFMLIGESQIYDNLTFDPTVINLKDDRMNLLNGLFSGVINGNISFMQERFPLRFLEDGTFPEPELELDLDVTLPSGNTQGHETIPNPAYVNAPYGIAFLMGYQPYETLKVGPPPSEFASGSMTAGKFHKLRWNGEIRMTDDVLTNYGGQIDTNKYGEYVQFICDATLGIIANTPRFCLPLIYRRLKTPSLRLPNTYPPA